MVGERQGHRGSTSVLLETRQFQTIDHPHNSKPVLVDVDVSETGIEVVFRNDMVTFSLPTRDYDVENGGLL